MTYRLIVDGNLYSRKGVFNENLFASCINTSTINGYNDNSVMGNSILNIGNYTNTLNMGGIIPNSIYRSTINFNGDVNVNGAFTVNGTFNYPNSFDYIDLTKNVSIGFNQNDGTTINLGNINKSNLNTNIYGNKTRNAYTANNCIDLNTTTNAANIDFYSNDNNVNFYGARINSTGGNVGANGTGTLNIYSGTLNLPNTINSNNTNYITNLLTTQTTGGDIILGSSSINTSIRGSRLSVPNNISSSTTTTQVNLFTNQTTGGDIILGSSSINVSVRGSRLSVPNNISSSTTTTQVNLFTNQTTGGDIILGSSSINVSVRGSRLSVPNNISSSNTGATVNLFTDQTIGGNINIGSNNVSTTLNGTSITIGNSNILTCTTSGKVCIGPNSTSNIRTGTLNISSLSNSNYGLYIDQGDGSNVSGMYISNSNGGSSQGLQINIVNSGTSNFYSYAKIQGKTSGVADTTHIAINPDEGNVGIGTTTPGYLLDVSGTINCNTLRIDSFLNFLTSQSTSNTKTWNTNYQNTKTTPIFINITFRTSVDGENFVIRSDANSSPSTTIVSLQIFRNDSSTVFIVLPSYYYRFERTSTGLIDAYCEWS